MNRYRLEVEIWAESVETACRALADAPVQAVVVRIARAEPGLHEATDSELEQELKLRNRIRLLATLREERTDVISTVLAASASSDILGL